MSGIKRREALLRVIDLCRTVEEKGLDPFEVDVTQMFDKLSPFLQEIKNQEEFYLDIEAVLGLAGVIFQQGDWIKHRSSLLYLDPLLVMFRLQSLSEGTLADIMMRSWHPVVSKECLSPEGIREALTYWENLPSLKERGVDFETGEMQRAAEASKDSLLGMGVIRSRRFIEELEELWRELREGVGDEGEMSYWEFIGAKTYGDTVKRAYMTSFLVSYGYVDLEIDPLEERIIIRPLKHRLMEPLEVRGEGLSVPISIPKDRWRRGRLGG